MHSQCDTRPGVTFPAAGHHCLSWYQIILLDDTHTHVNNLGDEGWKYGIARKIWEIWQTRPSQTIKAALLSKSTIVRLV